MSARVERALDEPPVRERNANNRRYSMRNDRIVELVRGTGKHGIPASRSEEEIERKGAATHLVVIPVRDLTMLGVDQDPLQSRHACDGASDSSSRQRKPSSESGSFLSEGGTEEGALVHALRAFRRPYLCKGVGSIEHCRRARSQ